MSGTRWVALLFALGLEGCASHESTPAAWQLRGAADLWRGSDGELRDVFHAGAMPRVQGPGTEHPGKLRLRVPSTAHVWSLEEVDRRGARAMYSVASAPTAAPLPEGRTTLVLSEGDAIVAEWPVLWVPGDEELLATRTSTDGPSASWAALSKRGCPWRRMRARVRLGSLEYRSDDRARALPHWQAALELADRLGFVGTRHRRGQAMAFVQVQRGRTTEAWDLVQRSLRWNRELRRPLWLARDNYLAGMVARAQGENRLAEERFARATELATDAWADYERKASLAYRAVTLAELARFDEAMVALELARTSPDDPADLRAQFWSNRASARFLAYHADFGGIELSEIADDYRRALELMEGQPNIQEQSNLRSRLAAVLYELGASSAARGVLRDLASKPDAELGVAASLARLVQAKLDLEAGDPVRASRWAAQAIERAHGLERPTALAILGRIELARGAARAAAERFVEALDAVEELGVAFSQPRERSVFYFRHRDLVKLAVQAWLQAGERESAWTTAERAQAYLLRLVEKDFRVQAKPELWRAHVQRRQRAEQLDEDCSMLAVVRREQCHAQAAQAHRDAQSALQALYDATQAIPATPSVAAEKIRAMLSETEAILAPFPPANLAFVVSRDRVDVLEGRLTFEGILGLRPKTTRVYLVPGLSSDAFDLPLAVDEEGRPWTATVAVSLLPTAAALTHDPGPTSSTLLIAADPDGTLPAARRTALTLAKLPGARLLEGDQATRERVLDGLSDAGHLHFSGHGELRKADPWSGELRLASQTSLTVQDVLAVRPRVRTVVLHGCRTGPPTHRLQMGFPQAWLLSGARAVLASTSTISAEESGALFEDLHKRAWRSDPATAWAESVAAAHARGDPSWRQFRLHGPL